MENEQVVAVTVDGYRYRAMLNEFLFTKIDTFEAKRDVLRSVFENRVIRHRADVVWLPRSCDLTPLDHYLRGADKSESIDVL